MADAADLAAIEQSWRDGKQSVGLDPEKPIKHSGDWPDREPRTLMMRC